MKRTLRPALSDMQRERINELADKFRRTRHLMWVCAFKPGHGSSGVSPFSWRFGVDKPPPVPNPSMDWRYPTLEEYLDRQRRFEEEPHQFFRTQMDRIGYCSGRHTRWLIPGLSSLKGR